MDKEKLKKENAKLQEKISVLLSCKNCPENKGGWICLKEYENKCLSQKIVYIKELKEEIAELEKENAELKEQIEKMKCCENCRHYSRTYEHCYSYSSYQNCKSLSNWRLAE